GHDTAPRRGRVLERADTTRKPSAGRRGCLRELTIDGDALGPSSEGCRVPRADGAGAGRSWHRGVIVGRVSRICGSGAVRPRPSRTARVATGAASGGVLAGWTI